MKILFITNESNRSGAPFVLLFFLQWIKDNNMPVNISILSLKGGELSKDFDKIADYYLELPLVNFRESNFLFNLIKKFIGKPRRSNIENIVGRLDNNYDLIYANTVVSLSIACKLKEFFNASTKLLLHLHELETVINHVNSSFSHYLSNVDQFLTASEMVRTCLIKKYAVTEKKVETVYEFVPLKKIKRKSIKNFVVGASGTVEWRKGTDLFLQIASQVINNYPHYDIQFCWVGFIPPWEKSRIELDVNKAGLKGKVVFTGQSKNPVEHFNNFDVFALTSREDPFPLVCIEAGMMGIPILCFSGATGTEEILKTGGGEIVPYLDILEMSNRIIEYYENREKLTKEGEIARKLFSRFTPSLQAPKIYNIITSMTNS